ncbi:armadillo/beta-catenin-like repeat domain containing protein, putative [Babesia bigemina]|uniref:Importin subunit alpha n=1 Tax=Babesia bigemina TaxID=5866 RepID=A0A061DBW0_BABBI|nr:armadillo/beta-catenin-like repeat domain containing protein, putative [Babesia bigemina]CDR97462.1 armadillo/beta-catenin-like repeat domain containing protein, putative [Babesia bigemina]|eukprot:XP_012769648.1 armadillo/beta-catenin-like repeat domain containing protein, putative [Babesia bigemina]
MFRKEERKKEYKKIFDDSRRRREDLQAQIRKQTRDRQFQRHRACATVEDDTTMIPEIDPVVENNVPLSFGDMHDPGDRVMSAASWSPSALAPYVTGIRSDDYETQLICTKYFRKLLSIEVDPPIEQVVNAGVVPVFIEFLGRFDAPELQFEAAWAITNVASGNQQQTKVATDNGAVPKLIALLEAPREEVREQAIWALGNIAGDSPECRDLVLGLGALKPLLFLLANSEKESVVRNATWTVSNLCRGKPKPVFQDVQEAIPYLAKLLNHTDTEVLTDACWALSYISDGNEEHIQAVLDSGACPRLVQLLDHPQSVIQTPALRTVGNIATGNDRQTQMIVDCGCIPILYKLLFSDKKTIKKEACWTLSNIAAGTRDQVEVFLQSDSVEKLLELMTCNDFDVQREASWAICNAASGGDLRQAENLASRGCLRYICSILSTSDTKLISVALRAMENILNVGHHLMELNGLPANPYAIAVEELDGVRALEVLQESKVHTVYRRARDILQQYFPEDYDLDQDLSESSMNGGFQEVVPAGGFQF